jgi:hypothetical protein
MKWWYLLLAVVVAGCASTGPGVDPSTGLRVTGNETSVLIAPTANQEVAFPLAERHCARYGKVAHYSHRDGFRQVFDCESRGR